MKNKIIDHFLVFSNVFLVLGIVITSILIIKNEYNPNINELYLPFYLLFFVAAVFLALHIYFKKQYLMLIKMHITKKTVSIYMASFIFEIVIMLFSTVWISCAPYLLLNATVNNWKEWHWYFYTLIGISMFFTIINICLDSYARFGVKIDLTKKRMGEPFGSESDLIKK